LQTRPFRRLLGLMEFSGRIKDLLRRRPLTQEEVAARAEAKLVREQLHRDRLAQEASAGMKKGDPNPPSGF